MASGHRKYIENSVTLSLSSQQGSIVLTQRIEANRKVVPVSNNSHFHIALEMPPGRTSFEMAARLQEHGERIVYGPVKHNSAPGGDGESGGNLAVYTYDPNGHYIELFYDIGTIENYKQRYGGKRT